MKFDTLCDIVLEGKKADRFARMVIGNATPTFSMDDLLRVPGDPSKGLITYLSHRDAKSPGMDPERLARRAVRRLNWVAKSAIKRLGSREISLGKLNQFIIGLLEKYQTKVLGFKNPDKMKTAQEARVIGNLLLPPTKHRPNAKGVFVEAPRLTDGAPDMGKEAKSDPERISSEFNAAADELAVEFDPDLVDTIKEIVNEIGETDVSQILKDARIKGLFEPRVVRKVIKGLIDMGIIEPELNAPEGEEPIEGEEDPILSTDIEDEVEEPINEPEPEFGEDENEVEIDTDDAGSAARLGYTNSHSRDEEEESDDKWYDS